MSEGKLFLSSMGFWVNTLYQDGLGSGISPQVFCGLCDIPNFLVCFLALREGGKEGCFVCFTVIPFCPTGAVLFIIKSQFRYRVAVEGSCTGS